MGIRRRRLPAVPPDPEDILTREARRQLQAERQLQEMIDKKILPNINRLLGSDAYNSTHVGSISIGGSTRGVHIYEVSGTIDWVRPLLASLRGPAYRGYVVTAVAEWREPVPRSISRRRSIPLNEANPHSSLAEARKQQRGNSSVYVGVRVGMSR
jgi:hypothetical protein